MKKSTLLICLTIPFIASAQHFATLPSESFFSPYSLHHASFAILPTLSYRLNSKGPLFNSANYGDADINDFMTKLIKNGKSKNYLSFNLQSSLLDYHRKTNKGEIGFGIGLKAGGLFLSQINLPSIPENNDTAAFLRNLSSPDIKIKMNAYTAVSYAFSYLKNVNKRHLQNYGFRIELLTGLNAVKGYFKSNELKVKDTNTINMIIKRNIYVARSKEKLYAEELLPFYRNPGIALSYGLKWQLSNKNKMSFNITNFGFIYFSRTKNNLHRGIDTLNLKSEEPFKTYSDSLRSYSNDHNDAYYFLPFDINAAYEHQMKGKQRFLFNIYCNPILRNTQFSFSLDQPVFQFQLIPSLNLFNFNQLMAGFGLAKKSKFISWGININYLAGTIDLYKNAIKENYAFNDRNNFQTSLYVYYHLIRKTKRQTSRHHKLTKTYVND